MKTGINFKKLKNESRELLYLLYCLKEITERICNNLIKTVWKIETIFINTENSKTNEGHWFKLHLANKGILKISIKVLPWKVLAYITHGKTSMLTITI